MNDSNDSCQGEREEEGDEGDEGEDVDEGVCVGEVVDAEAGVVNVEEESEDAHATVTVRM